MLLKKSDLNRTLLGKKKKIKNIGISQPYGLHDAKELLSSSSLLFTNTKENC